MEAKSLIPCSLQGAGSCSLLLLHLAHAILSILFPVLLPGSTCCLCIHFVINNIAQMLVSPGERKLLCCAWLCSPLPLLRLPAHWQSEAWHYLYLTVYASLACHEVSDVCANCQWDYLCNCDITLGDGLSIAYKGLALFRTEKDTRSYLRSEVRTSLLELITCSSTDLSSGFGIISFYISGPS